jgi:hypothetical protein
MNIEEKVRMATMIGFVLFLGAIAVFGMSGCATSRSTMDARLLVNVYECGKDRGAMEMKEAYDKLIQEYMDSQGEEATDDGEIKGRSL